MSHRRDKQVSESRTDVALLYDPYNVSVDNGNWVADGSRKLDIVLVNDGCTGTFRRNEVESWIDVTLVTLSLALDTHSV